MMTTVMKYSSIKKISVFGRLIRPEHWIKNLLVFVALFFSFSFDRNAFYQATLAFIAFSLFASSIYIINDIFDKEKDRLHPLKRKRPIASGKIRIWQAIIIALVLIVLAVLLSYFISEKLLLIGIVYFVLNLSYSISLKHIPIVDTMIVALGFVLRVMAGAYAIDVSISHWLLLCTFFISLFLAFGKRKHEMSILDLQGERKHRKSIAEYTEGFISQMLAITAGISVVFYSLYTIDPSTVSRFGSDNLIYTTPIVVFGVLRDFYLLYNKNDGGDPVNIFSKDLPLILDVVAWIVAVLLIYYF